MPSRKRKPSNRVLEALPANGPTKPANREIARLQELVAVPDDNIQEHDVSEPVAVPFQCMSFAIRRLLSISYSNSLGVELPETLTRISSLITDESPRIVDNASYPIGYIYTGDTPTGPMLLEQLPSVKFNDTNLELTVSRFNCRTKTKPSGSQYLVAEAVFALGQASIIKGELRKFHNKGNITRALGFNLGTLVGGHDLPIHSDYSLGQLAAQEQEALNRVSAGGLSLILAPLSLYVSTGEALS
jgi:hypothetical protein